MRILGIEFGTWSLKAVEMESRFRKVEVLDFHEVRLPLQFTDPTATYGQALTQLIARLPSNPEKIVTSIPSAQTALRFLKMPLKARKQVEKSFRFELEDNVPFKLDDSIIEHHVDRTKDGSLVFAAIAPKRHVQAYLEWLRSVGIDPDWLSFEGMGLINIYLSSLATQKNVDAEAGPVMLLDMGHLKTNISIYSENRLEHFRSVAWGGAAVTQAIAVSAGCSLDEAERLKMNDLKLDEDLAKASPETRELVTAASQAFSSFIADLNHSMVSYRNTYKVEVKRVLITGGTSKTWGVENFLQRALGLSTDVFHPFEQVTLKEELESADEHRFGEPLGRSMVFARNAALLFNFRQQEAAKGTSLTEVSAFLKDPNILRLLKFGGALALILFFHVFISGELSSRESATATEELRKVFAQTFPNVPSKLKMSLTQSPKDLKKFIDQKNQEIEQKLKMLSKGRTPMMSLIRSISEAFPPTVKVDVNSLKLDDRTFSIEGVLYSGDINQITDSLKKVTSIDKVQLQREGQRFTYRGEVIGR